MSIELTPLAFARMVAPMGKGIYFANSHRREKPHGSVEPFNSISDMVESQLAESNCGMDTWFSPALYRHGSTSRCNDNLIARSTFTVDLDAGPGKPYSGWEDALECLLRQCAAHGFPEPLAVRSGAGIHGHWLAHKAIPKGEWVPLARRLSRGFAVMGIHQDKQGPTVNPSCFFRIPGTVNRKQGRCDLPVEVAHVPRRFASGEAVIEAIMKFPKPEGAGSEAKGKPMPRVNAAQFADALPKWQPPGTLAALFRQQGTALKPDGDGGRWRGRCPLHGGDNQRSLRVHDENWFRCWSCGRRGGIAEFMAYTS